MTLHIGMLLFPDLTQLDLTGPFEILHRVPDSVVHLAWKDTAPIVSRSGLTIMPTTTLDAVPPIDVLFVPGGYGMVPLMSDETVLAFLRAHGERASWVTAVCTGSLLLGAAGLLRGYRATTHWAWVDLLAELGAEHVPGRVVEDRNRITGGGVTAGIDFGLLLAARLAGEDEAKSIQLGLEYDPQPPFHCGHPDVADPELVARTRAVMLARRADAFSRVKS